MTKKERLLSLLAEGWTSPLDALREAGTMKLSTRISDLRKEGYVIEQRPASHESRFGGTDHYNEYRIKEGKQ